MRRHLRILAGAVAILSAGPVPARATPSDPSTLVFVASASEPEIAVIDSGTDRLVRRLPLPAIPRQIGTLDRGRLLVVGDGVRRRLHLVDAATGTLRRDVETSVTPAVLQVGRRGTILAVGDPAEGRIEIFDMAAAPMGDAAGVTVSGLQGFGSLAFDGRGRLLVATGGRVRVVDAATGATIATLAADDGSGPVSQVVTDAGGEYAFAVQGSPGILTVFELKSLRKAARLTLPAPAGRMLASADSQFMLLPVAGGRALSILSTWTLEESGRIPMSSPVGGIGLGLFQSVSVGIGRQSRTVQPADLRDRRPLAALDLPGTPVAGAASPDGAKFYVALGETGQVAVLDLLRGTVAAVVETTVRDPSAILSAAGDSYCH